MPTSAVRDFIDPEEHSRSIRGAEVQFLITGQGQYRAEVTKIDLHKVWMQTSYSALAHLSRYAVSSGRSVLFFVSEAPQGPIHHTGMELAPGQLMFDSIGTEHYHRMPAGTRWRSMSLKPDDLAAAGRALVGVDLMAPIANRRIRPSPQLISRLSSLHEAATRLAATVPDILAGSEVAKAIDQELVRAMVGCLVHDANAGAEWRLRRHMRVMRRFEDVLHENEGRVVYIGEICASVGVSERTLRAHCMEHLGMSPHRYLWLRRMNMARCALAFASPHTKSVTEIATEYGFWELGRFSVEYRRLFGERPSTTLRGHEPGGLD